MQLNNLLTYLLNENLDEVAKSLADAQGQKLALYRDNIRLILIDPDAIFKELESVQGNDSLMINVGNLQEVLKVHARKYPEHFPDLGMILSNLTKSISDATSTKNAASIERVLELIDNIRSMYWDMHKARLKQINKSYKSGTNSQLIIINKEKEAYDRLLNKVEENFRYIVEPDATKHKELKNIIASSLHSGIVGYIRFEMAPECSDSKRTYQVISSAALKGWGPLMYDIAMSVLHPNYLTADRNSNSADADKVWTYYLKNRSDVNKELMEELISDDECELPTSSSETVDNKLDQARMIIAKSKKNKSRATMVDREIASRRDIKDQPPDDERLMDVREEIKKVLADVPQAWRYQIKTPIDISALDNRYKLFIGKALSRYKANITPEMLKLAAGHFFDSMYSL